MKKYANLIILGAVAIVLVAMVIAAILINPWAAAAIPPVLYAIAAIIREMNRRGPSS